MEQPLGSAVMFCIGFAPQQGRNVFTVQALPASDEPLDHGVGKEAGFSLHAGVAGRADER